VVSGPSEELFIRTLVGYLRHPAVRYCLLLEHGCEKTHNEFLRQRLVESGVDPSGYGWASIQLDGGIARVTRKVQRWFEKRISGPDLPETRRGLEELSIGMMASGPLPPRVSKGFARLARMIVAGGGTVVVPSTNRLASSRDFIEELKPELPPRPSLAFGQRPESPGLHLMEIPGDHWVETLTGVGASGVHFFCAHIGDRPRQGHPMVPVIQFTSLPEVASRFEADLDLVLQDSPEEGVLILLQTGVAAACGRITPRNWILRNTDFQMSRGLTGISA
jgi:altronate dehydratase